MTVATAVNTNKRHSFFFSFYRLTDDNTTTIMPYMQGWVVCGVFEMLAITRDIKEKLTTLNLKYTIQGNVIHWLTFDFV